ncbi:TetR/AcrR family transcriptional regulator [Isoptericola aurantiacus]|uniref:TetR/AcrR family transcriptional regulator n=1 Tax=Isoptericola aurantiacus TaxID=3377839 RepID=UPI003839D6F2
MASTGTRTGRPSGGDGSNRERILAAARREFAAHGYRGATLRSIAAAAGFDIALIAHYFGNKDGLFAATMAFPDGAPDVVAAALSGPLAEQGERLSRAYLGLWEDPATSGQMHALTRSALGHEQSAERLGALVTGITADSRVGDRLDGRRTGFVLAMSHLAGTAFARYLLKVPLLADLDLDTVVARTAPAVQVHLTTPDDPP